MSILIADKRIDTTIKLYIDKYRLST